MNRSQLMATSCVPLLGDPKFRLGARLWHPEPEMGDRRRGDHPRGFEPDRVDPELGEQGHTAAQEHGCQVDLQHIEHAGLQILLDGGRAPGHSNILVARRRSSLLERGLDPVGDE